MTLADVGLLLVLVGGVLFAVGVVRGELDA